MIESEWMTVIGGIVKILILLSIGLMIFTLFAKVKKNKKRMIFTISLVTLIASLLGVLWLTRIANQHLNLFLKSGIDIVRD